MAHIVTLREQEQAASEALRQAQDDHTKEVEVLRQQLGDMKAEMLNVQQKDNGGQAEVEQLVADNQQLVQHLEEKEAEHMETIRQLKRDTDKVVNERNAMQEMLDEAAAARENADIRIAELEALLAAKDSELQSLSTQSPAPPVHTSGESDVSTEGQTQVEGDSKVTVERVDAAVQTQMTQCDLETSQEQMRTLAEEAAEKAAEAQRARAEVQVCHTPPLL